MRKHLFLFILLINIGNLFSENISFQASAPNAVVKGEQFRLSFVLTGGEGSSAQFPTEINGFEILYGPTISQRSTSTIVVNGKASSETTTVYTLLLSAQNEGTYTIPSANVSVDGKKYTSNSLKIKVLPPDKKAQSQQNPDKSSSSTAQNISSSDAFIRAIVSKSQVHEQEAFIVTFRFYTTLEVRDIGKIEFPEFEGFMAEEQDLPANRQLSMEHYNGRNYFAVDLKKTLLFPQKSGEITIPAGKIEMTFHVRSGKKVQTFFGMEEVMTDVKRLMTTSPLKIKVIPLPDNKPAGFSNAVGKFNFNPKISATKVKANDAITISLEITGTGNLKLIKNPEIKFPTDFETYDPKITNDFKITENGLTGSKVIEYLFIPRHQGVYTIPPIEFSYFDTQSKSYKTSKSPEYTIDVAKDPNAGKNSSGTSYSNQTDIKSEQDIRYLKNDKLRYNKIDNFLFGSISYIMWYIIPIILCAIFLIYYRKQLQENANINLMRNKRANKIASKHLKIANTYLVSKNKEKFYEEVLRATWGYLSDKLLIPAASLNRDNIENELIKYGATEVIVNEFIAILDKCEFARYAPIESNDEMDILYSKIIENINAMEDIVKNKNSKAKK